MPDNYTFSVNKHAALKYGVVLLGGVLVGGVLGVSLANGSKASGGVAASLRPRRVAMAALAGDGTAMALLPTSGVAPASGTSASYSVPFTIALVDDASGADIGGATVTVGVYNSAGTLLGKTTVTTSSSGAVSGSISITLTAGDNYSLEASFAGATISGVEYLASTASQSFSTAAGVATTLDLTYTGG